MLLKNVNASTWGEDASTWLADCFAREQLLGDSLYIPEILKPAGLEWQYQTTESGCPACDSMLLRKIGSVSGVQLWHEWACPTCGPLHGGTVNQGYRISIEREEHAVIATFAEVEPQAHLVAVVRDEAQGRWLSSKDLHPCNAPARIELPFNFTARPVWGFVWVVGLAVSSRFFVRMKIWLGPLLRS